MSIESTVGQVSRCFLKRMYIERPISSVLADVMLVSEVEEGGLTLLRTPRALANALFTLAD